MIRARGGIGLLAALVLWTLAVGCESTRTFPQPRWVEVRIDGFATVAGRWAGMLIRAPQTLSSHWVRVRIGEDGSYEFASHRAVGVFRGRGTFTLRDGRLIMTGEEGPATLTLHADGPQRRLQAVAVFRNGIEHRADLRPQP